MQKAQQDLQLTKATLDSAQRLFDSRQALYKQGAAAAKDVDDARLSLLQAQDQYQAAQKAARFENCRRAAELRERKDGRAPRRS